MDFQQYRAAWDSAFEQDPPVPPNVDIELASACNARCGFCLYGDRDWVDRTKRQLMPRALALQIIDECAVIGVPALKFNFRGESLIHPDYGDIVEYARDRVRDPEGWKAFGAMAGGDAGKPAFLDLLSNTNGNIPPALFDQGIRGLMACTKVMVSLDSMDPVMYPKLRVGLSLDSAQRTISELIRRGHPNLWVRRVITAANRHEDFVGTVRAAWPNGVRVSEHHVFDRNHYEQHGEAPDPDWPRQYCGYPSQRVVIEASGRYSACCIAWEGELSGGRYPKLSIMDYWRGRWRGRLVRELRDGKFSSPKCRGCTSYMAYRRPEREFVADKEVIW